MNYQRNVQNGGNLQNCLFKYRMISWDVDLPECARLFRTSKTHNVHYIANVCRGSRFRAVVESDDLA